MPAGTFVLIHPFFFWALIFPSTSHILPSPLYSLRRTAHDLLLSVMHPYSFAISQVCSIPRPRPSSSFRSRIFSPHYLPSRSCFLGSIMDTLYYTKPPPFAGFGLQTRVTCRYMLAYCTHTRLLFFLNAIFNIKICRHFRREYFVPLKTEISVIIISRN